MNADWTYLDFNATAPVKLEVSQAMSEALQRVGNPSSVHRAGRLARRRLEEARVQVAQLAGVSPGWVVFTSGGTEANTLALNGTRRRRLIISATEHDSVRSAAMSRRHGCEVVPVDGRGLVNIEALDALLSTSSEPALVSVMLANNETGVLQPIVEISALARRHDALLHCDAVQAAGKIELEFTSLGAHLMSLSAHKIGGPQGVGALIVDPECELVGSSQGGGQEMGRRPGTENVPGIVGFGVAAELAQQDIRNGEKTAALRDGLEARLERLTGGLQVFGQQAPRLPNTSCFTMPGVSGETQVMSLDLAGVAVSSGAACSSGKVGPSHVLQAMGASESDCKSAIRVSLGWTSTANDIDRLVAAWMELYSRVAAGPVSSHTAA